MGSVLGGEREPGLCRALARERRARGARGASVRLSQAERGRPRGGAVAPAGLGGPAPSAVGRVVLGRRGDGRGAGAQSGEHGWRQLLRRAGATFTGLRLLDGALVLKVSRGRETGQLRVLDGAAFDPAHSGLEVAQRQGVGARNACLRVESLEGIVFGR